MAADWSSLPLDVLCIIACKLESFEEFIYFSVVCRWWNRASSSIKHGWRATPTVPWLLLAENTKENPNCIRKIFNHNNSKNYKLSLPQTFGKRFWGSAYGWVAMIDHDYSVRLFNPITKAEILFPSLETIISDEPFDKKKDSHKILQIYFKKLIVLKVPRSGQYEFVIMVVYDFSKKLAFARHEDESWTSVLVKKKVVMFGKILNNVHIVDVVGMGDRVFALYDDGEIVCWNANKFQDLEPLKPEDYIPSDYEIFVEYRKGFGETYLVQSGTDLLMLLRYKEQLLSPDNPRNYDPYIYKTEYIEVYKLDLKDKRWHEIEDAGDVALFVGCNSSMSVSVLEATCFQRNCVYFNDDENECWSWDSPTVFGGHDMGVYDIKSEEIWRFYEGDDTFSSTCPPNWFVPEL